MATTVTDVMLSIRLETRRNKVWKKGRSQHGYRDETNNFNRVINCRRCYKFINVN